jgi:nucleotide-binding universal stress UspA family protein
MKMDFMKTIIVPTDFSPVAMNALNYALDMAKSIEANIILLNTYQAPVAYSDAPVSPVTTISLDDIRRSSEERLADLQQDVARITGGTRKVYIEAKLGNTVDVLEEMCSSVRPFAVVMGSHGSTGVERLIMGSTTLSVIRHLRYPVIVVPSGTTYKEIRKVGLACDFKDVMETIPAEYIRNIVNEFNAELHVLNINPDGENYDEDTPLESAWLDSLLVDIKPNYYFLKRDDIVEGINEFSEKHNLDVVIVIPKKHNLLEKIFHKSRSKELVKNAHIPIVSIHE